MPFVLLLYWHGFCCLLRASTPLILRCISLDILLSHSLPALVWLSLPPCISATVWTKVWNSEFYWYWSLSRVLTCGEHPRSLEIPDCTQCAFKLVHKFYCRSTLWLEIHYSHTYFVSSPSFIFILSSLSHHTLGDLAGSFGWRINSKTIRPLGFRVGHRRGISPWQPPDKRTQHRQKRTYIHIPSRIRNHDLYVQTFPHQNINSNKADIADFRVKIRKKKSLTGCVQIFIYVH